jgi:hypothetical protein
LSNIETALYISHIKIRATTAAVMADDIPHLEAPADEVPAANDNVTVDGGAVAQSIGTPQKDTAMPDAPIEPGSVRFCILRPEFHC